MRVVVEVIVLVMKVKEMLDEMCKFFDIEVGNV